ncbi:type I DNA topoisomerase [Candidatus Roizmanbacteria bacterium]|nr:type I DNA topoisomerase [Candidatus Roizmanbacteria bacterium]
MSKTVIIVESPTKARTLSRFLGNNYAIEASMGHIRDLPEKKLGVDIEKNFHPTYEISKKKKDVVARLRKLVAPNGEVPQVILATDPDREGEAIAWHVAWVLGKWVNGKMGKKEKPPITRSPNHPITRIVFHQITKAAIEESMKHPRTIDMHLVDAQQGRRVLDRLMGYKLSPLLWTKTGKNWLSAGRVQSVAVRIIVEREREIQAFVAEEYWIISAQLKSKNEKGKTGDFIAELVKIGDNKPEVKNKEQADVILAELEKANYQVLSVKISQQSRHPYGPFITSTLQRTAATVFGWSARKTMTVAQNLYEEGKITYHRTDSVHLSPEGLAMGREYIKKEFGAKYVPEKPNVYKTSAKVAQEAHEAIRPTALAKIQMENSLGRDHDKLLDLITRRFLASQMSDQVVERTTVEVTATSNRQPVTRHYLFRASGEREVFDGWRRLFPIKQETPVLPQLTDGDPLDLLTLLPEQKFTQPPARYNEASLIKALEEQGIGRPSTYAPTIHTIQLRQYVEKNESRAFIPTDLGTAVNDFLVKRFGDIVNVSFTAKMEDELDDIANGKVSWQSVIADFWGPFEKELTKTRQTVEKIEIPQKETGEKCPECGSPLVERTGKFGKFIACSGFPKCTFTKPLVQTIDVKCPNCGGDIVIKRTKRGRKFFGCSNYPNCTFASWNKPGEKVDRSTDQKINTSNNQIIN